MNEGRFKDMIAGNNEILIGPHGDSWAQSSCYYSVQLDVWFWNWNIFSPTILTYEPGIRKHPIRMKYFSYWLKVEEQSLPCEGYRYSHAHVLLCVRGSWALRANFCCMYGNIHWKICCTTPANYCVYVLSTCLCKTIENQTDNLQPSWT